MNYSFRFSIAMLLVVVLQSTGIALAQSESGGGAIQGTVLDPSGTAVSGARVKIMNPSTGYVRMPASDAAGRFQALALPVGSYTVEVVADGFGITRLQNVGLEVGQTVSLAVDLRLAGVQTEVSVTAAAEIIDTENAATSSTISQRSVADLPIRGRNFAEFAQLTPAIVQEPDRFGLVVSGQRSINSNVSLDGADFNDALQGNQRGGNTPVFFFPQTAVREFQVVRSGATAEIGRTNAGFVNVVTKSGTNDIHGELFYLNRNKGLTSKDAFDRKLNNQQNQFGGSIGGPLKVDKAFFFGAVEQNILRVPFVVKFQDQAAGVALPADIAAQQGEQHGTNNPTSAFLRNDFNLSSRSSLNTQYTYSRMRGENFNFDSPQLDQAASSNYMYGGSSHAVKAGVTSVLSASLLNEARTQVATDDRDEQPNSNTAQIVITGLGTLGSDTGRPRKFHTTRFQITDNVSWTSGTHQLRLGLDSNMNRLEQERESNIQGRYDFSSLANYLALRINRYRQTLAGFNTEDLIFRGIQKEMAFFIQDKIAISSKMTLSAGLRWEGQWNPQPTHPNPAFPQTGLIPNDLKQWQPRLGLTISPARRSVLRLSGGIYTARTPGNLFQRVFTDNGITTVALDSRTDPNVLNFLSFPQPITTLPSGLRATAPRVFGFHPDFVNPRSFQGGVAFEQGVGNGFTLSTNYIHSSTWNLQRRLDRNLFAPTINAAGIPIFPPARPDPTIAQLEINESSAHSRYDAFVVSVSHPLAKRYQVQASYTLARNLDDDSNERNFSRETALNPFDLTIENAYSKYDVRHNFIANTLIDIGRGFTAAMILQTRSGLPYTATTGSDAQGDANDDNDRAIFNGRASGRNEFRQPNFFNLDLRLMKNFTFAESKTVALSVEGFNVTRATNKHFGNDSISIYGTPASPVATGGQPLFAPSAARFGGPRQVQLGVRLLF